MMKLPNGHLCTDIFTHGDEGDTNRHKHLARVFILAVFLLLNVVTAVMHHLKPHSRLVDLEARDRARPAGP